MTLLMLLLTLAVVAGIAAVFSGYVTGGMSDADPTVPQRALPEGAVTGEAVRGLRFVPALRGYRMDQVDAALDRLGDEIDRLRALVPEEPPAEQPVHQPVQPPVQQPVDQQIAADLG